MRFQLLILLAFTTPLSVCAGPSAMMRVIRSVVTESEQTTSTSESSENAVSSRREAMLSVDDDLATTTVLPRVRTGPVARRHAAERPVYPGHRWLNGLNAPLRT